MVDLLPEALQRWQAVEAVARQHFLCSGFGEIRTPLLESTDLFCRGIGEGTDVVGKEMYSFSDRGDRSCTLRPEGTASVVRAALQHGLVSQGAQKLWYAGPMFRYERPQAGRHRCRGWRAALRRGPRRPSCVRLGSSRGRRATRCV